jgi:hypothetical protein
VPYTSYIGNKATDWNYKLPENVVEPQAKNPHTYADKVEGEWVGYVKGVNEFK